jgi:ABC-2 type transport system permease protein
VTGLALRQVRRGALLITAVAAGMSALVVATYRGAAGDGLDAASLTALAENPAIRTLFGEPVALDDAGGFAVWRTGTVLAVLLSVWGLLAATRLTRGEEDAGRWDLLLAGRIPVQSVVLRHLAVLVAAMALAGAAVTGALVASGTSPVGAALHGGGLALIGMFFVAAGGLAAQVFPARSTASGAIAALLGAGLLVRMVGDGVDALAWLRWLSPFGLLALSRPYEANRAMPLAILAVAAAGLLALAVAVAARRDVRGGLLAGRSDRPPRLRLLGSTGAFAVRQLLPPLAGWSAGIGAYFLLIGLLAVSMTEFLADNPQFADLAAQAGFASLGTVTGYVATLFALLAIPAGVFVAVRVAAAAADEADRRLTLLYAGPVTRIRLLTAEIGAALGGAVVITTTAGAATWLGAATVDADLGLVDALVGAWNVLPIVLLCLGAAVLALGWAPRAVAGIGALPAAGGFLLQVIADSAGAPAWVGDLSPFAHLAAVPHAPPDWPAAAVMTAVAATCALVGAVGYRRRDLSG